MIEDKELGVKVAESPIEAIWENVKRKAQEALNHGEVEKEINLILIKTANEKLKVLT